MGRLKYRPDILIIRDILNAIGEEGITISALVSRARVPHDRLKPKINQMIESGLIYEDTDNDKRIYKLTRKGWEARIRINEMVIFLKELGLIDYTR